MSHAFSSVEFESEFCIGKVSDCCSISVSEESNEKNGFVSWNFNCLCDGIDLAGKSSSIVRFAG